MSDVRDRLCELHAARERTRIEYLSGRTSVPELARVYDEFGDLAAGDPLDALEADLDATRLAEPREEARRLWRAAQALTADADVAGLAMELCARRRAARVRLGAEQAWPGLWERRAAGLVDRDARRELQAALEQQEAELDPLREELRAGRAAALARRGLATPRAWAEALWPDVDLLAWERAAERFLSASEPAYRDALQARLAEIDTGGGSRTRLDVERAFSLPRWEQTFGSQRAAPALERLLEGWDPALLRRAGIAFDLRDSASREPGARCLAPRVPGEVVVLAASQGDVTDYFALFEATGAALQAAYTSESLPIERRCIGDPALGLAFGLLLADRLVDAAWIEQGPVAQRAERFVDDARGLWLFRLRERSARGLGQLELSSLPADADVGGVCEQHAERMADALGHEPSARGALRLLDDELSGLDALRAACLAAQLSELLRERWGRRFWAERGAVELLKELWNTGTTYTACQLAEQLGIAPLDVEFLIHTSGEPAA